MHKLLFLQLVSPLATAFSTEPALTIYNQNFAVVRDTVLLALKAGSNDARFTGRSPWNRRVNPAGGRNHCWPWK